MLRVCLPRYGYHPPHCLHRFNHGPLSGRCIAMSPLASARATVAAAVAAAGSQPVPFAGYRVAKPKALLQASASHVPSSVLATERIGLILPTSLCSGEVARKIVNKLNGMIASAQAAGPANAEPPSAAAIARLVTRFECLPHTEGCGTGE